MRREENKIYVVYKKITYIMRQKMHLFAKSIYTNIKLTTQCIKVSYASRLQEEKINYTNISDFIINIFCDEFLFLK